MADRAEDGLPGRITEISPQKKRRERYNLFVEGDFLMGISEDTLLRFGLGKGERITPDLFRKLQEAEGRGAVKSYMLKMLARRDHSRRELRDKAGKKELNGEYIEEVLDELERQGLIDDAAFAEKFASDKFGLNRWGPAKIKSHLYRKGISRGEIDRAIRSVFGDRELEDTLRDLVLKRKRHFLREDDPLKRKKKIFDYLARKGFKPGTIHSCLDELVKAVSE